MRSSVLACGLSDLEQVLAPVGDDAPCGVDPRSDASPNALFFQAKDARSAARRIERANDAEGEVKVPRMEWQTVADRAAQILREQGKDLEVASWLVEAALRLDGFAGLRAGLDVARELVERYWEQIFPLPDDDGLEGRLIPFTNLNGVEGQGALIQPLRLQAMTGGDISYLYWQYEQAHAVAQIVDAKRRDERIKAGAPSMEAFADAVQQTPAAFYASLLADLDASLEALKRLSDAFAARVGRDAPPTGAIHDTMAAMREAIVEFAATKLAQIAHSQPLPDGGKNEVVLGVDLSEPSNGVPGQALLNRDAALVQIQRIAAFFREHEPHSPICYTLEEIVRRARLPLPQLLDELIVDQQARRYFFLASGLTPPAETG